MTPRTKTSRWLTATVVVGLFCTVGAAGLVFLNPLSMISLSGFGERSPMQATAGYADHTDSVCRDVCGCVQGYSSENAEFRKFDFVWNARAFAESHPNTYQSNVVVIEYTNPRLTEQDREDVQDVFDNVGNSDASGARSAELHRRQIAAAVVLAGDLTWSREA